MRDSGSLGTAALVTRATHDVDTVSWVASMLSGTVATIPMLFLGGVVLAMRKDVVLSLVLLAFVPLLTLIVVLLGKRVLPLWGKSDDYIDVQNALLRERLRGIRVIRAFNTEKQRARPHCGRHAYHGGEHHPRQRVHGACSRRLPRCF